MLELLEINHAQHLDRGRVKTNNEDFVSFFIPDKKTESQRSGSLFILADGVSGASHGEIASKYAAELALHEYYQSSSTDIGERLVQAFLKANQDINDFAEASGRYTKMATTLVAAVVHNNQLTVANVGDSRAYLIRKGQIRQITRDHSVVAELVRNGEMTEEEAQVSSIRNRLSRSIGGQREVNVDLFPPMPLEIGDRILLCSDGLSRYATPEDLLTMAGSGSPRETAQRLVRFANHQGGADNISVSLMEMVQTASRKRPLSAGTAKPPRIEDWQNAETEVDLGSNGRKKRGLAGLLIALGAVVFIGGMLLVMVELKMITFGVKATITPTIEVRITPTVQLASTLTPLITDTPEFAEGMDKLPTQSNADSLKLSPESNTWECVFYWKPDDESTLSNVLASFNINYDEDSDYLYYDSCETESEEGFVNCLTETPNILPFKDHWLAYQVLQNKWLIVFDRENSEKSSELCRISKNNEYEGKIHILSLGGN